MKTMQRNKRNRCSKRGGFTLLEVMIVLFILVTLAAFAVVAVQGQQRRASIRAAFSYVKLLERQVDTFQLDVGRPPTTEEGIMALIVCPSNVSEGKWGGPYLRDTASDRDPWGNVYQYSSPGRDNRDFAIWSFGPDGTDGTDDDIGSWMSSLD